MCRPGAATRSQRRNSAPFPAFFRPSAMTAARAPSPVSFVFAFALAFAFVVSFFAIRHLPIWAIQYALQWQRFNDQDRSQARHWRDRLLTLGPLDRDSTINIYRKH